MMRWATLFYALLAGVALAWNGWAGRSWLFADAGAAGRGVAWGPDLALGLASAGVVIALSRAISTRTAWGRELARELGELLGPLGTGSCLWLAALSGFAEEAFFRGALQPRTGWLVATLLFGAAHFAPRRALWPWTLFALLAGAWLGGLYAWTGNLVAPVVAHAAINAVNLRLLTADYRPAA